jgi:hypothetical protein
MRIENQVCTVEQAKRLKELGIKQAACFSWMYSLLKIDYDISYHTVESLELLAKSHPKSIEWKDSIDKGIFSAFLVSELGVMLPDIYAPMQWYTISNSGYNKEGNIIDPPNSFSLHIGETTANMDSEPFDKYCYPTEAQARAAYLIHLLESKSITATEVNKRFSSM